MKLALLFDYFGPYHLARLGSLAGRVEALGLEFYSQSGDYAWTAPDQGGLHLQTVVTKDRKNVTTDGFRTLLFARLDAFAPDVVAIPGWASREAFIAIQWCQMNRVPAVLMSESTAHDESRQGWKELVKQRVVGLFSAGFAGGASHSAYLQQLGMREDCIFLGYDAVDNSFFSAAAEAARGSVDSPPSFLASARFIAKKNLPNLLRAFAQYREETEAGWSLVLLGDGEMRADLEILIQELNIGKWVSLPGFKQYDELPGYYARASAFIHASTTEQWGLVVNEAMASGLPVLVSSRCGCAPDLVAENCNGWTFDPSNVKAMADVMKLMASQPQVRLQTMGRKSQEIVARWGPQRFAEGLLHASATAVRTGPKKASLADRLLLKLLLTR